MNQNASQNNPNGQSVMLTAVLSFLIEETADESHERLGVRTGLAPSWIRAIREGRSTKPDINRIEYLFINFCGGQVVPAKSDK